MSKMLEISANKKTGKKNVTVTLPDGNKRTFTMVSEPSNSLILMVTSKDSTLDKKKGETKQVYANRVYKNYFSSRDSINEVMRMCLYGDHTGIDWFVHVSFVDALVLFVEYLTDVMPKLRESTNELVLLQELIADTTYEMKKAK